MAKTQAKQFVVCIDNEDYLASLEKRKIYIALRDAAAEKHGLLRIVDESGEELSSDRPVEGCEKGGSGRLGAPSWTLGLIRLPRQTGGCSPPGQPQPEATEVSPASFANSITQTQFHHPPLPVPHSGEGTDQH